MINEQLSTYCDNNHDTDQISVLLLIANIVIHTVKLLSAIGKMCWLLLITDGYLTSQAGIPICCSKHSS